MVLDRIAQVVLIVFGALLLALLVLGLAISCRPLGADPAATATALAASATPLVGTQVPAGPSPTAPSITLAPSPTPTGPATAYPGPTATPTPTTDPGAVITPGATTDPAATTDPGATVPGATAAPGATAVPPIATVYVPGATVGHIVSRGEWMLQIARCYGVDFNALLAANPMPNPHYILPGQRLTVPNIGSQGPIVGAPCVVAYTVAAGDTWQSLAQRHATTTAILQRANPGALVAGRAIWVPRVP